MYRIFLVEDDEVIAGAIADGLTRWGFEPYICNDFQNVTEEFLACDPHLTLLDISPAVLQRLSLVQRDPQDLQNTYHVHLLGRRRYEHHHGDQYGR